MLTYPQMLTACTNDPALMLVDCKKVKKFNQALGVEIDTIEYINPPLHFEIYADFIEPENVVVLRNLDYVSIP